MNQGGNYHVRDATPIASEELRETVRAKYAEQARRVTSASSSCCEPSCCGGTATVDPITGDLYAPDDAAAVPEEALKASLGCGNPTALAELEPGETVLDLGSGGGIDVLLSARRVGPTGFAYGLDMTDEMLALAEQNKPPPAPRTCSSSRVISRTFPCPRPRWTSSSPTA